MKTIITFKALSNGRVIYKNIPIYHNFEEIPATNFNGLNLPPTSVESQVIHYLDEVDKKDIMNRYNFDIIIDYFPKKKRVKKDEFKIFLEFISPYISMFPQLKRPIGAIISESHKLLFGKGKTNEQKFKEVLMMLNISLKASIGTMDIMLNIIKESDSYFKDVRDLFISTDNYKKLK